MFLYIKEDAVQSLEPILTKDNMIEVLFILLVFFIPFSSKPKHLPENEQSIRKLLLWKFRYKSEWRAAVCLLFFILLHLGLLTPNKIFVENQETITHQSNEIAQLQFKLRPYTNGTDANSIALAAAIERYSYWEDAQNINQVVNALETIATQSLGRGKYQEAVVSFEECYALQSSGKNMAGDGYPDDRLARHWPLQAFSILKSKLYAAANNSALKNEAYQNFTDTLHEKADFIHQAIEDKNTSSYFTCSNNVQDCLMNLKIVENKIPDDANGVTNDIDGIIKQISSEHFWR
jgi:hypothetical protein